MRYERLNERWIVRIQDNGAVALTDRRRNVTWGGHVPGWVTMRGGEPEALGAPVRVGQTSSGAFAEYELPRYAFRAEFALSGDALTLTLTELRCEGELEAIEYPAHMLRVDSGAAEGYVVVPHKQGALIPSRLDDGFMRYRHNAWRSIADVNEVIPFEFCGLNMTWFGASRGGSSVLCYLPEAVDMALHLAGNAVFDREGHAVDSRQGDLPGERYSSLTPVWRASRGCLRYPRQMILMLTEDGYVGMAKRYRALVKSSGRYVSLEEKVRRNPAVAGMIGAPDIKVYIYTHRRDEPRLRSWSEPVLDGYERVHTTFDQVGEIVDDLQASGVEKALILLGGWNRAGYDREHIDMWPPAEAAGGAEGLARASVKAVEAGYVFSLHDNYQDIYPDSPSYDERLVMKRPDGSVRLGGVWDGGLCRLVCSSQAVDLARRTIRQVKACTSVNSYYLDTTTSAPMYECYDEAHPMTRADDRTHKRELLEELAAQGWVVGAEAGVDWAVPAASFFEGMPGDAVGLNQGAESANFGMMIPLFNLVYHDAVVCYWQHGQPFGREDHINHVLHDLLSAQPSSWSLIYEQWEDLKPLILQCSALLGRLHARTAFSDMTRHELVTPDFQVHHTAFSNGVEVWVNFDIRSRDCGGFRLAPKGFRVSFPGEEPIDGRLSRDILLNQDPARDKTREA